MYGLGMGEAMRVIDEGSHGFRRADTDSGNGSEASDGGRLLRLIIQVLLDASHLAS